MMVVVVGAAGCLIGEQNSVIHLGLDILVVISFAGTC
jgi:hypothetical protein